MLDMPPRRITLKGFGEFHYKWGKLWAYAKSRPLSRLVTDVFEARVEANKEEIETMIRDIAEQNGMTYEAMVEEIMQEDEKSE